MPRYFLEVAYKGTHYSGFQSQKNANSIQAEIESAFAVLQKEKIIMTGSSRTDAGVHALQNYLHFDTNIPLGEWRGAGIAKLPKAFGTAVTKGGEAEFTYRLNAILPDDIVVKAITPVAKDAHCRFDAKSRTYKYYIYQKKNPFLKDRAFYFPYKLDREKLIGAAEILKEYSDFTSFSKRNTQVKTFICNIMESGWLFEDEFLIYTVKANRFLRGMVRALTATMLKVGRGNLSAGEFRELIEKKDFAKASFTVPAHGLILLSVEY